MTLGDRLAWAKAQLDGAGIASAQRDAQLILAHCDGRAVGTMSTRLTDPDGWTDTQADGFALAISERVAGKSVAKIIGSKAFWNADFFVNSDVLDPRPDTETLVASALEHPFKNVLDLGTGSGCILLSLLLERPNAKGLGVDLSDKALAVARKNADRLGCKTAQFVMSDWFNQVTGGPFDLIVSNPPYIAAEEMDALTTTVLAEPHMALTDGADGLTAYRLITQAVMDFLQPNGRLIVEIGPSQAADVKDLFTIAGLSNVTVVQDFDRRDRVVQGMRPS